MPNKMQQSPVPCMSWKSPPCHEVPDPPPAHPVSRAPRSEVNICRAMLEIILPGEQVNQTTYRRDAVDEERKEKALPKRYCNSKQSCLVCQKRLPPDVAKDIVRLWCGLSDEAQTHYIASMYEASLDIGEGTEDVHPSRGRKSVNQACVPSLAQQRRAS